MRTRVLTFAFLTIFLDLIGFGLVFPLMPLYVRDMGGTAETVGLILSAFSFTQLIATPLLGRLSDRVGRRSVILVSLAGNAFSMVVFALATKLALLPLLFVSRIVAGATAGNIAACQAAVSDVSTNGEERAQGMGRLGAAIGLGLVLGPVAGSALAGIGAWAPPLAAAALAVLNLVGAFFLMPETLVVRAPVASVASVASDGAAGSDGADVAAPRVEPRLVTLRERLRDGRLTRVLAIPFFAFFCMANLQMATALLVQLRLGWGPQVGKTFGMFGIIALVVQGILLRPMARALGEVHLVTVGCATISAGMMVVAFSHTPVPMISGLALVAIGFGAVNPTLSSLAAEIAGARARGAVLGLAQSSGGIGRTIGPIFGGMLYARVGPSSPFVGAAICGAVSGIIAFGVKRAP